MEDDPDVPRAQPEELGNFCRRKSFDIPQRNDESLGISEIRERSLHRGDEVGVSDRLIHSVGEGDRRSDHMPAELKREGSTSGPGR